MENAGHQAYAPLISGTLMDITTYEVYIRDVFSKMRLDPRADVDDLTQDVFLCAWNALRGGIEVRHPNAWLRAVCRTVYAEWASKNPTEEQTLARATYANATQTVQPDTNSLHHEWLMGRVEALPSGEREVVKLMLNGYSSREVSRLLGINRSAYYARLSRAKARLRTK